jgi:hypothetical protein
MIPCILALQILTVPLCWYRSKRRFQVRRYDTYERHLPPSIISYKGTAARYHLKRAPKLAGGLRVEPGTVRYK